jgi:hypothetical protein
MVQTVRAVRRYCGEAADGAWSIKVTYLRPSDSRAQALLRQLGREKQGVVGRCSPDGRSLLVIADATTPAGAAILRHETAHAVLAQAWFPAAGAVPFWLGEGLSTLFEMGVDAVGDPLANREREEVLRYLLQTRRRLPLQAIFSSALMQRASGNSYAIAWGLLWLERERGVTGRALLERARANPPFNADEIKDLERGLRRRFGATSA